MDSEVIYRIYIEEKEFVVEEIRDLDNKMDIINNDVLHCNINNRNEIYCTEENIIDCKKKLINHCINEQDKIFKEAWDKLTLYNSIKDTIK